MWKRIEPLSKDEARATDLVLGGKARFLVDQNIGKLAEILKDLGYDAVSTTDVDLDGHDDGDVFSAGWRLKRVILTSDRDFLDDRRFPLHRCAGVVVIPNPSEGMSGFAAALGELLPVLKRYARAFDREKTVVNADRSWTVRGFSKARGVHRTLRMRVDEHGQLWEWDGDR